jgi:RNA polymerase sigma-70 factor, ECF subfamily
MFTKDELNQLYRYALSLSAHEAMAYDLLQSALERYLTVSRRSVERPLAYIKTIIRHLYFDMVRHEKVVPMVSIESDDVLHIEPVDEASMEAILINQQEVEWLISVLTAEENELLYLWAVEEYSVAEIAALYEKPRGTMLSKLHRLKKRIREQFQDRGIQSRGAEKAGHNE